MIRRIGVTQSLLTLANAACGFMALSFVIDGSAEPPASELRLAASLILLGLFFDTLDGVVARMTKHASAFGRELDSLADVITFGVAPAVLAKTLMDAQAHAAGIHDSKLSLVVCLLFLLCAVLRLARFNAEKSEEEHHGLGFFGLPTPGGAGVIAALALIYYRLDCPKVLVSGLVYVIPLLGLLMVSRIPYSHVGSLVLKGKRPFSHLLKLVFVVILASVVLVESLFVGFVLYAVSGPARLVWNLVAHRPSVKEESLF